MFFRSFFFSLPVPPFRAPLDYARVHPSSTPHAFFSETDFFTGQENEMKNFDFDFDFDRSYCYLIISIFFNNLKYLFLNISDFDFNFIKWFSIFLILISVLEMFYFGH